jgi:3-deoxy-D-manno-octulosonic-acid transferase
METELWPNTLAACAARHIPTMLINGRLSERSARGYQRFSAIARPMLQQLTCAAIQHRDDALRFAGLGLPVTVTQVTGNIKFDLSLDDELVEKARHLKRVWSGSGRRLVWIAASTHPGEDEQILDAFSRLRKLNEPAAQQLLLVLVPRHPERFESVGTLCEVRGFRVARRSKDDVQAATDIVLGDTMGELLLMFGASDIAFVGGSLVANGGHNFIEPAVWQLPLLSGIHLFNFAEVARLLSHAEALVTVTSVSGLVSEMKILIVNADERARRGVAARAVADANRGALARTLAMIERFLPKRRG